MIGLSAYRDVSGMFTTKYEDYADLNSNNGQAHASSGFGYMKPEPNMRMEDEEDLLYGEGSFKMKNVSLSNATSSISKANEFP